MGRAGGGESASPVVPTGPSDASDLAVPPDAPEVRVRRTSHLDLLPTWPEDPARTWSYLGARVRGACRDTTTGTTTGAATGDDARLDLTVDGDWVVTSLATDPPLDGVGELLGAHSRRGFRRAIDTATGGPDGSPAAFLLRDVATFAVIFHYPVLRAKHRAGVPPEVITPPSALARIVDVCVGWAADHTAARAVLAGTERGARALPTGPSLVGDWHAVPSLPPGAVRRTRRFDLWREGADVVVDAGYRDTYGEGAGVEGVIHEYGARVRFDRDLVLTGTTARPRVLPFPECPIAVDGVGVLTGVPATDLAVGVRERLHGTRGCTHLNDLLGALVDLPTLVARLDAEA